MSPTLVEVHSADGHTGQVRLPAGSAGGPRLFWLPALGVTAQKYDAFGQALAAQGITLAVHEWRGNGSSSRRAKRGEDWGYRELLREVRRERAHRGHELGLAGLGHARDRASGGPAPTRGGDR